MPPTTPMAPMTLATLGAGAALLLAACAAPAPPPGAGSPPVAAPPAWQTELPAAVPGAATAATWWQAFGDPLLPELIAAAEQASPGLSTAALRIEQARAARQAAASALLPAVDAAASVGRARTPPRTPASDTASLGVQAGWEIDVFGARGAARDAATQRLEAAQAAWHAARVALAAEIGSSYVALRACEAQLEQTRADLRSREQTAGLTEHSARTGLVAPASAALARASAAQARAQQVQQASACASLVKSLVALTAVDEPALRRRLAAAPQRQPEAPALRVDTLPAALLERRPDLVAAARQVQAAAADRNVARGERWPRLALTGAVGALRVSSAAGTTSGSTWSLGPLTLSLPLFDGGRRAANEAAARAAYDDAVVQLQGALRGAVREVEDALLALASTAAREGDARIATEGFEASLRATEARQRGGVASLFELEDARRSALAANGALIELRRERAAAWITLYRSLGGGFDAAAPAARPRT
jgi:NodT family efflux transporter outer membrane factor (OMF) lipoprotein